MSKGTVEVPRGLLVGLVTALALAVLAAVFLMGRQSASPRPSPATAGPPPATEAPPAHAPAPEPARPVEAAPTAEAPPVALAFPTIASSPPTASADPSDRDAVARYFQDSESIQARAKYWTDPQALAKTLLEQASSGNSAGLDQLLRTQQQARAEMERLTPPTACAEYHRRSLDVMADGLALLEQVQGALAGGDPGGLMAMGERGRELEREARAIDELGRSLRQQYGL
jgi:hypothetical protein